MPMNDKIAGCVVLFQPDENVPENIRSYVSTLDLLLVMDNSPDNQKWIKESLPEAEDKMVYFPLENNKGIAYALNKAAEMAMAKGCHWLLTMDQDSHFKEGDFVKLTAAIEEVKRLFKKIGIITPFQQVHHRFSQQSQTGFSVLRSAMTSGNLLNLQAWAEAGPFAEKLFIDYVDHEFCLRVRKNGFSIVQVNDLHLVHSLGRFEVKKFFGKTIGISNHNADRRYYIMRNGLYTAVKYVNFDWRVSAFIMKGMITDLLRVLVFEKKKGKKIKAMLKGSLDAIRGHYGKLKVS